MKNYSYNQDNYIKRAHSVLTKVNLTGTALTSALLTGVILTGTILTCAALTAPAANVYAAAVEQKSISSPEDAENYIRELLTGDAAALETAYPYTEQMNKAISASGGMEALRQSLASLGELSEIGTASVKENKSITSYSVPCVFSTMKIDLVLSIDENNRIAGLVTGPYTGKTSEPENSTENDNENDTKTKPYTNIELSIPVDAYEGELPGTLTLPEGDGPFPAVVLIHGSGPNDRDETIMDNKPFRDIAEGLAQNGIAVYRFDKRTYIYGSQIVDDSSQTLYEETIQDAVTAVQVLSEQDSIDPSRIFVLGHSLGGMSLPAIDKALKEADVSACGYIFLAAPARNLVVIMREQYDFLYSMIPELSEEQQAQKDAVYQELDTLEDLSSCDPDVMIAGAYPAYWQYLKDYDILKAAKDISVPCLLLQGEEDYQVTMEDYSLWQETFADNSNWQFQSYPGLVHIFVPGQKEEGSSVYMKAQKVDDAVIKDISAFILTPLAE